MSAPDIAGAPSTPARAGSLIIRVASAAVLIAIVLTALVGGLLTTSVMFGVFVVAACIEFYLITLRMGVPAAPWVLVPLALVFFFRFQLGGASGPVMAAALSAAVVVGLSGFLWTARPRAAMTQWGMAVAGALYIGWSLGFYMALFTIHQPDPNRVGIAWLVSVAGSVAFGDTLALLIGSRLGRHPFFSAISPHKTVEGAVAGFIGTTLMFSALSLLADLPGPHNFILGALLAIVAQAGDLIESQFKRSANLKDASSLIPGHGGFLDRMDSMILAPGVAYYYLMVVLHVKLPV